eukprot:TRINITY_DN773_c0_g1_i1.p1 TRINITY_DN773_c0_g1~~TRINITY_DN773_c0_g1_i1.p1  ORF type:complete len:1105 (+),score=203.93 TRINITY_DN773_c0_g1_i1:1361-4675(+)
MASELQQFELLIKQLMSIDNNARGQAEAAFNSAVKQMPDRIVIFLLQLVRSSSEQHVRELCTILLRKTLVSKMTAPGGGEQIAENALQLWNQLSPQTQQTMKTELLLSIEHEQLTPVRKKLADTVSELALCLCTYLPAEEQLIDSQWPDLMPFLFRLSQSPNDEHRRSALDMFSKLCLYLGESIKGNAHLLKEILTKGLTDTQSLKVRLSALSATVSFIQLLDTPEEKLQFKDFTLLMFETVSAALNAQKQEEALEALQILVELADIEPTFMRPHIATVVNAMLTIANTAQLSPPIRQLGLEFLITLAEQRAGMVRKIPGFVQNLVPVILNFMIDLDEEWSLEEDDDEEDSENSNHVVGDECLDRLALALGGKTIAPILFQLVPSMLSHQDWKHRHTGLMAISLVGEGCERFLTPHLKDVLGMIVPHFSDQHPRVRWAACNTIGQMSSDFGPRIQSEFHSVILPCLVTVMDDKSHPRVQSHAASAIINFCEHCTQEILAPFLEGLLSKLGGLLQGGKRIVQEQAITAIAAMADVAKEGFLPYYDSFMPFLKTILANATSTEYRMLRGKAMECISLIAVAVGKDKFMPDAKDVINALLITQQSKLESDDPQISFLLQAWARICKAIGQDFVPYLDVVIPPLLGAASQEPDLTVTDEEGEAHQEGWQYIPVGDKRIGINTSTMEEKATACSMILQYVTDLQEGFFKYVEPVANALLPLTKFYFHDGVRSASVQTMPALLESVKIQMQKTGGTMQPVHTLFAHILVNILEAISAEVDMDIELVMIDALSECLDVCEFSCMNEVQITSLIDTVKKEMSERDERKAARLEERQGEDFDEEEAEKLEVENEKEEELLSQLAELLGKAVKYSGAAFLRPFSDSLLVSVLDLLRPDRPPLDRQVGICIFDDVVEFTGAASGPLLQHFLVPLAEYMIDSNPGVRQAAVYGIGLCAQHGGDQIAPLIEALMKRLGQVITHAESRTEENVHATENAISAWGKFCQFQGHRTDLTQALAHWISWLPVSQDVVEAKITYAQLCFFFENHHASLLGQGFANLRHVLNVIASVRNSNLVDDRTNQAFATILANLQRVVPEDVLNAAIAGLTPEQRAKLS